MTKSKDKSRPVTVQITRFGHQFRVAFRAGSSLMASDSQASLYIDDKLVGWLSVNYREHEPGWQHLYLDPSDDTEIVSPEMLGLPPETEGLADNRFLTEAEEYILSSLSARLIHELAGTLPPSSETAQDPRMISPKKRGLRVAAVWHDTGRVEELLPELVATEVLDTVRCVGAILSNAVDVAGPFPNDAEKCKNYIEGLIEGLIEDWQVEGG